MATDLAYQSLKATFLATDAWKLIQQHYGDRKAERSQIPLINHIVEGVWALQVLHVSNFTLQAFALHPLFQDGDVLAENLPTLMSIMQNSPEIALLILEYRRAANAYLCRPLTDAWTEADIIQQVELEKTCMGVKLMLIADKWQNQKDFKAKHLGTHARSKELEKYFGAWEKVLDPTGTFYARLNAEWKE